MQVICLPGPGRKFALYVDFGQINVLQAAMKLIQKQIYKRVCDWRE